jgi:hypothetical protein
VIVKQRPMFRPWIPEHDYPWLYSGESVQRRPYGGEGQIVSRQTLKSDAAGRATFAFDTQKGAGQDLEFAVEARVTDASRRQIAGSGRVRVARFAYAVRAKPAHNVHRPGDKVEFLFDASDANENPVEAEGRVTVVRNRWVEVWIDPSGKEVRGGREPRTSTAGRRSSAGTRPRRSKRAR